jgi:hypothetical protein
MDSPIPNIDQAEKLKSIPYIRSGRITGVKITATTQKHF